MPRLSKRRLDGLDVSANGGNLHGMKPRIFLGSSGKQAKLVQALTRGLADVADVEPWTAVFNPGVSTLDRLVELTREVDFAAFVFALDDWTSNRSDETTQGQASPRDNVVFEAGLFGGALGMRRTFILHAKGAKLPTDLLGMTEVRYPPALTAADMRTVNQKLRKAIEDEGRLTRLEGDWWQHSLTLRTEREPSAISLLRISRDREGGLEVAGRGWQEDGTLSVRYWSEASKEHRDPVRVFYFWNGERPRHPNPAARGHGRDPTGGCRSGLGVLDYPIRGRPSTARTNLRCLPARRSGRHARPRWRRGDVARSAPRRPTRGMEGDLEFVSSVRLIDPMPIIDFHTYTCSLALARAAKASRETSRWLPARCTCRIGLDSPGAGRRARKRPTTER